MKHEVPENICIDLHIYSKWNPSVKIKCKRKCKNKTQEGGFKNEEL